MFKIKELVLINKYVQGIITIDKLTEWFLEQDEFYQKDMVKDILSLVIQSHPENNDLQTAVGISKIKKTSTAVVMLSNPNKNYLKFGYEVVKLSGKELKNAWIILLNVLKIADTRRRLSEDPATCNHWWHKDLRDEAYVLSILSNKGENL